MSTAPGVPAGRLLAAARRRLAAAPFRPASREAGLLLASVLGVGEASLLAHPERPVDPRQADRFERLVRRRLTGEPVAYLLGVKEFYGRPFRVDRRVLIPRPETELLVEACLGLPLPAAPSVLDLGTGCGAIAVTLALELPAARVTAVDLSPAALAVARGNARRLEARIALAAADLVGALRPEGFDLVVSNPPYVAPEEAASLSPEITSFEPHLALFAGASGRAVIERLLTELEPLAPRAHLALEIGAGQAADLERLAPATPFRLLELRPDYAGIARVALLRRRSRYPVG